MKASEVMTKDVVTVRPDTPVPQIARLLLAKRISAVPVVDDLGLPIGMVSEGDLIGRDEPSREIPSRLVVGYACRRRGS